MDRYKKYNKETKIILEKHQEGDVIPFEIYGNMCDKTSNIMSYLLNLLWYCQSSSISYFKYRKEVQKLINKQVNDIKINPLNDEVADILTEFNKLRN